MRLLLDTHAFVWFVGGSSELSARARRRIEESAFGVAALPFHHRDPFDRLLAVQAAQEGLTIVSRHECFDAYGVRRIW